MRSKQAITTLNSVILNGVKNLNTLTLSIQILRVAQNDTFLLNMKHLSFLLPFLLFIACTPTSRNSEWLKQAEAHYEAERYDSTLTYLYKIDENRLSEEENRTFLRLTYSIVLQSEQKAIDKMHELTTYYQEQNDTTHLQTMRAILFRNYSFRKEYEKADSIVRKMQQTYHIKNDTAGYLQTYSLKTNLHENIGNIDSALYYIDKRMEAAKTNSQRMHLHYRKSGLLLEKQAYPEAEAQMDSAKALAIADNDEEYLYHLTARYTQLYEQQKRYAELMQLLKESRKYMKRKDAASHNMYKAHVHELMHREDSALYYYDLVAKSENLFLASEALYHLSEIYNAEGDDEKAYLHHQDATGYISQVYQAYRSQAKNNAFNQLKWQTEIDGLKISRQQQAIVILSLVLVLIVLIASGIIYLQSKKKKEMKARQIQIEQENQLLRQAEELNRFREKANSLREELIRRMEVFHKVPSLRENEEGKEDKPIELSKEDWKEIKTLLDKEYDGFTSRLKETVPTLNTSDIQFCCLLKVNVSMQDIANIYHISRESASRRKQRVKVKFGNELLNGLSLDEFLQRF